MDNTTDPTPNQPQPGADPLQPQVMTPPVAEPVSPPPPARQQVIQPTVQPPTPVQNDVASTTPAAPEPAVQPFASQSQPDIQPPQPLTSSGSMQPDQGSKARGRKMLMGIGLVVLLLVAIAASVYFALANNSAQDDISALKSQIAVMGANTHELPEGLIQVTDCIPNMGFHYIDPNNDPRLGPTYLVSKDGEVIGFEYMFDESMLTNIPGQEIALEVLLTDGPLELHDWQYNSIDFSRSPEGHSGYEQDHFDVHVYTVTPEEQARACEQ